MSEPFLTEEEIKLVKSKIKRFVELEEEFRELRKELDELRERHENHYHKYEGEKVDDWDPYGPPLLDTSEPKNYGIK